MSNIAKVEDLAVVACLVNCLHNLFDNYSQISVIAEEMTDVSVLLEHCIEYRYFPGDHGFFPGYGIQQCPTRGQCVGCSLMQQDNEVKLLYAPDEVSPAQARHSRLGN